MKDSSDSDSSRSVELEKKKHGKGVRRHDSDVWSKKKHGNSAHRHDSEVQSKQHGKSARGQDSDVPSSNENKKRGFEKQGMNENQETDDSDSVSDSSSDSDSESDEENARREPQKYVKKHWRHGTDSDPDRCSGQEKTWGGNGQKIRDMTLDDSEPETDDEEQSRKQSDKHRRPSRRCKSSDS